MRSFLKNRRADTGSGAAAFILLLILVIIGYILSVDPLFREELLNSGNVSRPSTGLTQPTTPTILLHKEPGILEAVRDSSAAQTIDSIRVEANTKPLTVVKDRSIFVRNGLFSEDIDEITFALQDPKNTALDLAFQARKNDGRLVISLNGRAIYSDTLETTTPNPIHLPTEYLQENNVLQFRVAGPGWEFWKSTTYLLESVQLAGTFRAVAELTGTRNFIVYTEDILNTKEVQLDFTPVCLSRSEQGVLTVLVNGFVVSQGLPVCDSPQSITFTPDKLITGDNSLTVTAASGKYVLEPIKLSLAFKEPVHPTYFFELSKDQLDALLASSRTAELTIEFGDSDHHSLTAYINGHAIHIDEAKKTFNWNVESFLREGKNALKLVPESSGIVVLSTNVAVK